MAACCVHGAASGGCGLWWRTRCSAACDELGCTAGGGGGSGALSAVQPAAVMAAHPVGGLGGAFGAAWRAARAVARLAAAALRYEDRLITSQPCARPSDGAVGSKRVPAVGCALSTAAEQPMRSASASREESERRRQRRGVSASLALGRPTVRPAAGGVGGELRLERCGRAAYETWVGAARRASGGGAEREPVRGRPTVRSGASVRRRRAASRARRPNSP